MASADPVPAKSTEARALRTLRGVFLVVQPLPAAVSAVAGAIFYAIAGGRPLLPGAVMLFASIFLVCAAFNAVNDYHDRELDRLNKPAKPIVRGDISPPGALAVAVVAGIAGLALSLAFNPAALAIAILALACGLVYDFWLKGSLWSWIPYGIFVPALPVWALLAAGKSSPVVLACFPLGILMALGLNLCNTLPDIAGDTAFGLRGLAHRLGLRRSLALAWASFAGTLVLVAATPFFLGTDPRILAPGVGLGALLLIIMVADRLRDPSDRSLKRAWPLSMALSIVVGVAFVASLGIA